MFEFSGVLFGFGGGPTLSIDKPRLRILLEAYADMSALLFEKVRDEVTGARLPWIGSSRLRYRDPGRKNPAIVDCAITHMLGHGACGALSIYATGYLRWQGERGAGIVISDELFQLEDGTTMVRWHARTRRANGQIEDWSRRRGMKG